MGSKDFNVDDEEFKEDDDIMLIDDYEEKE